MSFYQLWAVNIIMYAVLSNAKKEAVTRNNYFKEDKEGT